MKFVLNMRRTLNEKGISNKRLSDILGISPSSVSQMLSSNNPTMTKLIEVATAIGIDVREFFYAVDDDGNEIDHANDPYLHQSAPLSKGTPALPFLSPLINSSTDENMKSPNDENIHSSNDEKSAPDGESASLPVGKTMKTDVLICPHCGTKFMVLD